MFVTIRSRKTSFFNVTPDVVVRMWYKVGDNLAKAMFSLPFLRYTLSVVGGGKMMMCCIAVVQRGRGNDGNVLENCGPGMRVSKMLRLEKREHYYSPGLFAHVRNTELN